MYFQNLAEHALKGGIPTREMCRNILNCPDKDLLSLIDAAYRVRNYYFSNIVHLQVLTNAKSGICQENCHYCSQSSISTAEVAQYPLMAKDELQKEAIRAKELRAKRFCMALSGRSPSDKEIDNLCEIIIAIKEKTRISLCCSIGLLKEDQAKRLKAAGLDRVNHNLNTSEAFYSRICSSHSYQDRMQTLTNCRAAGLEICSGGIFGMGETHEDVIDLLLALRKIEAVSIPLNFLIPVKGTPFEDRAGNLTPRQCLKMLCLARLLLPDREIRIAGGREYHLRSLQPLALYAANSIFVAGYLTTSGQPAEEAWQMVEDLGFEIDFEDA